MSHLRRKRTEAALARSAVLGVGLIAGAALAGAQITPAGDDWQLALQARHTLWDESPFDKLNLGVTVRNGVAVLTGPVPSTAVAGQAVAKLKTVPGIRDVQNDTYVPPADEPLAQSMPHPVTARRPSVSVAPAVAAPEPVPPPAAFPSRDSTATLGSPVVVPVRRMSIADQIESLRLDDRRFASIRVEVRGSVVTLRGTVSRSADAWDFAGIVRQIPGVERVVQSIETR